MRVVLGSFCSVLLKLLLYVYCTFAGGSILFVGWFLHSFKYFLPFVMYCSETKAEISGTLTSALPYGTVVSLRMAVRELFD